ncbi:hypothetical protein CVT24_012129 [Panaeolus cyanescens]|uniref:dolichyl-P-Glc:Man9GlcNAc2-PP-dolichol alpha-1,3-glucosyltransferase n=1 Tax=Panaeolus cyanescens TaxID=181874 RepID=A0A409YYR3_9AGAR|nr:hypothetical protein CVT24_012129 [Panaeolus cyanescens]
MSFDELSVLAPEGTGASWKRRSRSRTSSLNPGTAAASINAAPGRVGAYYPASPGGSILSNPIHAPESPGSVHGGFQQNMRRVSIPLPEGQPIPTQYDLNGASALGLGPSTIPMSSSTTSSRPAILSVASRESLRSLDHGYLSTTPSNRSFAPDSPLILAPTPRRHLLESSAAQHWLRASSASPPLSPSGSSRAVSPSLSTISSISAVGTGVGMGTGIGMSTTGSLGSAAGARLRRRLASDAAGGKHHRRTFSTLLEAERAAALTGVSSSGRMTPVGSGKVKFREPEEGPGSASLGRRWVRWCHKSNLKGLVLPAALMAATAVRWGVSLGGYSGQGVPPMYGDYEAQRHWMELTVHLPFKQWYNYDLQYWGLDYPPLTAYISWLCGIIAHFINPSWVALVSSRGIETEASKVFMRMTVLVLDALVYLPALLLFVNIWQGSRSKRTQELALLTLLFQPALLLIDFGHFQYNSVMLGFTLLAVNCFAVNQDLLGAVFFVLSLGFKQMALYYAPAIGSYLLAKCLYLGRVEGTKLFIRLGLVTAGSFALLFLPWLFPVFTDITLPPYYYKPDSPLPSKTLSILHPLTRIFPFQRGLFEDKVANFWCASNVGFKWRNFFGQQQLVRLSAGMTVVGFAPAVWGLLKRGSEGASWTSTAKTEKSETQKGTPSQQHDSTPFLPLLPYALLTSSMSFFLFSFQVHEKTILVPLLPLMLLMSAAPPDGGVFMWGALGNNIACFSMWPLLKKDGLAVQYIALLILWNRLIGYNPIAQFKRRKTFVGALSLAVYAAAIGLHVLELVMRPPARYPDLFPVLNVLISTPVFGLIWLWSIKCGVEVGWALGGWSSGSKKSSSTSGGSRPRGVRGSGDSKETAVDVPRMPNEGAGAGEGERVVEGSEDGSVDVVVGGGNVV